MRNIELNRMLRQVTKVFYFLRIWRRDEESDTFKIGRKFVFLLYYVLFQIFLVTCSVLSPDANESIFLASIQVLLSVVTIKLTCLLWNRNDINSLVFDPITTHLTLEEDNAAVDKDIKVFMKFVHCYVAMLCFSAISYVFGTLPMLTNDRKLPFFISYRLEGQYSEHAYWIAYVFLISEIWLGMICTLINILIWYAMFNYSLEYETIGGQMKNLGKDRVARLQFCERTDFHRDLIQVIRNHRHLSKTIGRFQSCFSKLFTVQIATSGLTICVSAYILANSSTENVPQILIFAIILIYAIFEILVVMYLANNIHVTSAKLSYCLFESNWIGQPTASIKCIIILGEVIRQPQQLVILKVVPVDLDTFSVIMKGAYNLFNILQNLN
uniref:Odorant receptor n=1 Tax=Bradysia odoriphaga TaxID=1564500 RepID=A0A6B9CEP4_9DIPT|nr:odorant receptor 39 [Bradysia odoriphaga]